MECGIPQDHALRRLFHEMVTECYAEGIGITDREITTYVADLLTEFCEMEQLYKIRNSAGKQLEDVGEMLLESDPVFGPAHSFDRERAVRKHVGDYTLFFAGMFPDTMPHRLRRQRLTSPASSSWPRSTPIPNSATMSRPCSESLRWPSLTSLSVTATRPTTM